MEKFGLQLYTIRNELFGDGALEVMKHVKELGYTYVQVAGDFATIERTGLLAKEIGLEVIGSVGFIEHILADFDEAVRVHKAIGAFDVGVSADFKCASEVEKYIENANDLADRLAKHGLSFSYHNHAREFIRMENGKLPYDMLIEGLTSENAFFMPDTYWIQFGGADIKYYIERLKGRIKILHLKDAKMTFEGLTFAEIGNGNLRWDSIIDAACDAGVEYFVVEQDRCDTSPLDSVKVSADYLKNI